MSEPLTDQDIRLHALNLAVAQRRDAWVRREDEPDHIAEDTLRDARLYADWLANGDAK